MVNLVGYDAEQGASAEIAFLAKALSQLAAKKREVFVLMAILELSATEAGNVLRVSANTAASRFRHAREELRKLYDSDPFLQIHSASRSQTREER